MQVTAIRIESVRNFRAPRSVDLNLLSATEALPRWIVVAGRNGAGKSTFLQAVAAAIAGPTASKIVAETFRDWVHSGSRRAQVGVRLRFSDTDNFAAGRRPKFDPWTALSWTVDSEGPEPLVDKAAVGGNWSPKRGPWAENPRGWFLVGYGPFRRLSPAPTEAQRMMMTPGRPASLVSLFREDASLSESILWLQQVYLRRLENHAESAKLETLILALLDDGLLPEGMRVLRVNSEGLWVRSGSGDELPLASLSDGYRTVAALVLDILKQLYSTFGQLDVVTEEGVTILNEGVVLVDEIDVHLHVAWQQNVGFWLKRHFPNIQFIVTTHSPFICQAADPGGLIRLPPPGSNEPAEVVTGELFARIVNGSADDAVLSDLFGLEHSYSAKSHNMRDELAELEAGEPHRKNALTEARIEELRAQLPTTPSDDVLRALEILNARVRG